MKKVTVCIILSGILAGLNPLLAQHVWNGNVYNDSTYQNVFTEQNYWMQPTTPGKSDVIGFYGTIAGGLNKKWLEITLTEDVTIGGLEMSHGDVMLTFDLKGNALTIAKEGLRLQTGVSKQIRGSSLIIRNTSEKISLVKAKNFNIAAKANSIMTLGVSGNVMMKIHSDQSATSTIGITSETARGRLLISDRAQVVIENKSLIISGCDSSLKIDNATFYARELVCKPETILSFVLKDVRPSPFIILKSNLTLTEEKGRSAATMEFILDQNASFIKGDFVPLISYNRYENAFAGYLAGSEFSLGRYTFKTSYTGGAERKTIGLTVVGIKND
ncbi:MAG: hypothetical protein WC959_06310 [Kiritimatiellales bacterium]